MKEDMSQTVQHCKSTVNFDLLMTLLTSSLLPNIHNDGYTEVFPTVMPLLTWTTLSSCKSCFPKYHK